MKYNFNGFHNWPAQSGEVPLDKALFVFEASDSEILPRDICEDCVCWRVYDTCLQVQVSDYEEDRESNTVDHCFRNCCPILFFDFIGYKLPVLEVNS